MTALRASLICACALSIAAPAARAEPESRTVAYSEYELQAIHDAERDLGAQLDAAPEGKIIERVDFVRLDPIDRHDPLPTALDVLHTTSREYTLRRALLVGEGEAWRGVVVDESARNLRRLRQLSLVVCVPMTGSASDRVRMVVITKDVWSLYVDFDLAVTSGGLESLTLEPKESNIAGTHHVALGRFVLEPKTVTAGARYEIPRLDGRWLAVAADANAVINRDTGHFEGAYGTAYAERPLFSSKAEWAWSTSTSFANRIQRRYVNAEVASFAPDVPWQWRERSFRQDAKITRSFGWETKNDFSFGAALSHARYEAGNAAFEAAAVPFGEDRVGPFVQWHGYTSDFLRTLDLDTLGLQEDHRLGHDLWLRLYGSPRGLGSTRDVFGLYAAAAYGLPLADGVARAAVETTVEATPDGVSDAQVKSSLGIATPSIRVPVVAGRVVASVSALARPKNFLNVQSFLGADSLLRGYPSRYLAGKDVLVANVEYRTRSYDLAAIQLGAAAFYDVGDAFSGWSNLSPQHSVGGGLRIVFPQIDRIVLRVDVGVPLGPDIPSNVPPVSLFIAFHQALSLPGVGSGLSP